MWYERSTRPSHDAKATLCEPCSARQKMHRGITALARQKLQRSLLTGRQATEKQECVSYALHCHPSARAKEAMRRGGGCNRDGRWPDVFLFFVRVCRPTKALSSRALCTSLFKTSLYAKSALFSATARSWILAGAQGGEMQQLLLTVLEEVRQDRARPVRRSSHMHSCSCYSEPKAGRCIFWVAAAGRRDSGGGAAPGKRHEIYYSVCA